MVGCDDCSHEGLSEDMLNEINTLNEKIKRQLEDNVAFWRELEEQNQRLGEQIEYSIAPRRELGELNQRLGEQNQKYDELIKRLQDERRRNITFYNGVLNELSRISDDLCSSGPSYDGQRGRFSHGRDSSPSYEWVSATSGIRSTRMLLVQSFR